MAVSDSTTNETEKPSREVQKTKEKKERPLTKVVVRRLPPSMDRESFLMQVAPVPDYDYIYTVKGDMSLGENAYSRVYINFVNAVDVFMFKEKFDNYVFIDQKGHEYPAVVEFASFQKIPRKRKPRPDPKSATIESDPFYLEFLESLKEQPNQDVKPEFSYQFSTENKDDITSTPLLDYIKQRRIDKQRIREERREERRRKELERKKLREDERKRHEQKSPGKTVVKPSTSSRSNKAALDSVKEEANEKTDIRAKTDDEKEDSLSEKNVSPSSSRDHKYDDQKHFHKLKQKYLPRSEKHHYADRKSEYKNRRDEYKEKEYRSRRFDDYKKDLDVKQLPRKTKKYSEKREERKNEARKAEQKKIEEDMEKSSNKISSISNAGEGDPKTSTEKTDEKCKFPEEVCDDDKTDKPEAKTRIKENKTDNSEDHMEHEVSLDEESMHDTKTDIKHKCKEHDPRVQRRIRNKDRPTMAIYQPGMLSKRKTTEGIDGETSMANKE